MGPLCIIASALLACPAGAGDATADVRYSDWQVRKEQGCTAAIHIIDANNFAAYVFGFTPDAIAVSTEAAPSRPLRCKSMLGPR